jgi:flagellar biogenesis protein FliO
MRTVFRLLATLACSWLAAAGALAQEYSPHRERSEMPAFPFRQVTAAEPIASAAEPIERGQSPSHEPLRLAPRNSSDNRSLDKPAATTPTTAVGTVVSSLAIVLGLFLAFVWCSKRFAPAGSTPLPKEAVELLGRAPLAGRQTMQLIRVGNRLLLVAMSPGGAETLTEITDPVEVEHLASLCRRGKSDSATASFNRALAQMASEPESPRSRTRGAA